MKRKGPSLDPRDFQSLLAILAIAAMLLFGLGKFLLNHSLADS